MDWPTLLDRTDGAGWRHLTARGKNIGFLNVIAKELGLDASQEEVTLAELKRACTPEAVYAIHRAIPTIWPDEADLTRTLKREQARQTGLYVGDYHPSALRAGLTRHSLYHDTILLVDPFIYPFGMKDDFNPLLHPEQFQGATLRNVQLWFELCPWIQAGLVRFIRTQDDFDIALKLKCLRVEEDRFRSNPELSKLLDEQADVLMEREGKEKAEYMLLRKSDAALRAKLRALDPNFTTKEIEDQIAYFKKRRLEHPYFIPDAGGKGPRRSEYLIETTGANYEMAKVTAQQSGSYLMTDLPTRWRELELDRQTSGAAPPEWEPFAKAFSEVPFKFLEGVSLGDALRLRQQERLASMRAFLRRVWKSAALPNAFDNANAKQLADALKDEVNKAEVEWKAIDESLTPSALVLAATGAGAIAVGSGFVASAIVGVANAAGHLIAASRKRTRLLNEHPPGFFLGLKRNWDKRNSA